MDILPDEDTGGLAKTLAGTGIRAIACLETTTRTATDVAHAILNQEGLRLPIAPY